MVKFSTLFFSNKKIINSNSVHKDQIYEPSPESVRRILDFAKVYEPLDLKNCKEKDFILN